MGKLTKNYIYNLMYQLFVLIVPLVTAPYLARTLGTTGTGIYSYINSTCVLVVTIVSMGIYNYGNRQVAYVRDDREKLSNTFWSVMTARLILGIIGSVIYFIIVQVVGRYNFYFYIYYTYVLAYFLDCTWLFVGIEDMKWAVIKNALTKVLSVVGIFVLIHNSQDTWKYLLILGGSVLISNLWAYTQIRRYVASFRLIFNDLPNIIKNSAILFLPSMATTVYLQCGKILIELITSQTFEVSYYDYSEKIVTIPLTFITVISTVIMPRMANEFIKGNSENIKNLVNKGITFSLFLACPMTLGLIVCARKLIPWYLGADFIQTIGCISILAPIIIFNSLTGVSGSQFFTATNQIGILLKSQVTTAVFNIILNFIMIWNYGFLGASIATLGSSFLCVVVQYYYLSKQVDIISALKYGVRYFGFAIVMACAIMMVTYNMSATIVTNLIQVVIGCIIYFGICAAFKDPNIKYFVTMVKKCFFKKI